MSRQSWLLAILLLLGLSLAAGCGDTKDDVLPELPTATPDPNASPTPTVPVGCGGAGPPPGCREFSVVDTDAGNNEAGTQLFFSSSIAGDGPAALAFVEDSLQIVAGEPDANGVAEVRLIGPLDPEGRVTVRIKPILDFICLRLEPETSSGELYCNGSSTVGVDTLITSPTGDTPPEADQREFGLGDSNPPGSMVLRVVQQQARIDQGPDANPGICAVLEDCAPGQDRNCYEPPFEVAWTTGTVFARKGVTELKLLGSDELGAIGEPFDCENWQVENGPGRLVEGLVDLDPIAGDVASGVRLSDR